MAKKSTRDTEISNSQNHDSKMTQLEVELCRVTSSSLCRPRVTRLVCLLQNAIASHESNGIDIIIALILNDINPLGKERMDLVLELKVRKHIHTAFRADKERLRSAESALGTSFCWHIISKPTTGL